MTSAHKAGVRITNLKSAKQCEFSHFFSHSPIDPHKLLVLPFPNFLKLQLKKAFGSFWGSKSEARIRQSGCWEPPEVRQEMSDIVPKASAGFPPLDDTAAALAAASLFPGTRAVYSSVLGGLDAWLAGAPLDDRALAAYLEPLSRV